MDDNGTAYILKKHTDMAEWEEWPLSYVLNKMSKNKILHNSKIFDKMKAFVDDLDRSDGNKDDGGGSAAKAGEGSWTGILNKLTIKRFVTLVFLSVLVGFLIRLYQYNLRLSAFWESRSDAILLKESCAEKKAETFDDLVVALAPDAYDFKPSPRAMPDLSRWKPSPSLDKPQT